MNICRLKPEFVEPLALTLFEEWHDFAPWSSLDKIRAYYAQCLNGDDLPLAFAAVDNEGRLMGSSALKRFDMTCFPEYEYWLGDVFVLPQFRGLGVGRQLVSFCLDKARELGLPHLFLYTPDVQAVYEKFGWKEITQTWHNGETVSVMKLDL